MRTVILLILAYLLIGLTSFTLVKKNKIDECYINFRGTTSLIAKAPDKLPKSAAKPREVETDQGLKSVSRTAGYRILYFNNKNAPFVNLKIEQSSEGLYETDAKNLIDNLRFLINNSTGMISDDVIELEFSDQNVYGLSRNTIEAGSTLGSFIMFPGNNTVIYFYFNNLKEDYRNFNSLKDYETQRDNFLAEYISHLNNCK